MGKKYYLMIAGGALLIAFVGGMLSSWVFLGSPPFSGSADLSTMRAERILIVEPDGRVVAELGKQPGHIVYSLCFFDPVEGKPFTVYSAMGAYVALQELEPLGSLEWDLETLERDLETLERRVDDMECLFWDIADRLGY